MRSRYQYGFIVLSIGKESRLYNNLVDLLPEVATVTVDIRKWIPDIPRHHQIRAWFPDDRVKAQVQSSEGFEQAVKACLHILREYGIVVVADNMGVYRAPTTAEVVQEAARNPYIVHCNVRNECGIHAWEAALLVRSCISSRTFSEARHAQCLVDLQPQVCLGWEWLGFVDFPVDEYFVPRGMKFVDIWPDEEHPGLVNVKFRWLKRYRTVLIDPRWIVPQMIFESRHVPGGNDVRPWWEEDSDDSA